ncbi:uncharacterized protein YnzC (UPF0291/DUF896 family) [Paenibacillus phyllosphaerae]|uniref:UPF0291 protein FHS18_003636 n=1 Tax=Paenibacillus phyllosphaerae TaxID=274593 RepID=A0A7W5FNV2_9BACL|nr:DUF896 domain-containing protein [Paenibacillus phyllosphaerae]MBB3111568.1 uncharacterized protein YnzC (UPF0291/DUF896 family) [Paenibacillus phyllosphaerae]
MIAFLDRINELSRKQRSGGLTENERFEQAELRQAYLREIRGQVRSTILSVSVMDEHGNDVTPIKLINERN